MSEKTPAPKMPYIVGLDIASLTFTVRLLHNGTALDEARTFDNDKSGYNKLKNWLKQQAAPVAETHVIMEATGVYWEECALFLNETGFLVSVVNPYSIKAFAKTTLTRAKTDATDADLIARYALHIHPGQWQPPTGEMEGFQIIMREREALVGMLTEQKNRLHALKRRPHTPKNVIQIANDHIDFLERKILKLENTFKKDIKKNADWQNSLKLLQEIPGVGLITAATLLTETDGLRTFQDKRQLTAYAGIAPAPFSSGTSVLRPSRISKIGNRRLRRTFYLAALTAIRKEDSVFERLYKTLLDKGKPAKLALVAVARKLLELCFTIVKSQEHYDPNYQANLLAKGAA